MEAAASAGTSAGVRQTRRGSFATCQPLLPESPLTATGIPTSSHQSLPRTPCTRCLCPISKVITHLANTVRGGLRCSTRLFFFCSAAYTPRVEKWMVQHRTVRTVKTVCFWKPEHNTRDLLSDFTAEFHYFKCWCSNAFIIYCSTVQLFHFSPRF